MCICIVLFMCWKTQTHMYIYNFIKFFASWVVEQSFKTVDITEIKHVTQHFQLFTEQIMILSWSAFIMINNQLVCLFVEKIMGPRLPQRWETGEDCIWPILY